MTLSPLAAEIYDDLSGDEQFQGGALLTDLSQWLGEPLPPLKAALAELLLAKLIKKSANLYFVGEPVVHVPRHVSARRKAHAARLIAAGVPQKQAAAIAQVSRRTIQRMAGGGA